MLTVLLVLLAVGVVVIGVSMPMMLRVVLLSAKRRDPWWLFLLGVFTCGIYAVWLYTMSVAFHEVAYALGRFL